MHRRKHAHSFFAIKCIPIGLVVFRCERKHHQRLLVAVVQQVPEELGVEKVSDHGFARHRKPFLDAIGVHKRDVASETLLEVLQLFVEQLGHLHFY